LYPMDKGSFKKFISGNTAHRFPKVVTLAVASCVLVGMIGIDASATSNGQGSSNVSYVTTTHTLGWNLTQLMEFANHWRPPNSATSIRPVRLRTVTTTTATPVATTTSTTLAPTAPTAAPTSSPSTGSTTTTSSQAPTTTAPPVTTTTAPPVTTTTAPPTTTTTTAPPAPTPNTAFPIGTPDGTEPSGMAPPSASALSGFSQSYVTDFSGSTLPSGWFTYSGKPGGDPGGQWDAGHVSVSGGLLSLNTYQDPSYNNEWVAGGLCQCGVTNTYGAYFVRSRVTGSGPTGVELLWPTVGWPPEIDFNETNGQTTGTSATDIWGPASGKSQKQVRLNIDMTQWHTWGVIWTPTSITYTVDGRVWGTMVSGTVSVPNVPMTLDLQQQTWCSSGFACPTSQQSMQVDWVAEYSAN